MLNFKSTKKGFTLIELLVVIGILATLLAITLVAINPVRQFQQANNTKRSSDVNAILNAVNQYAANNRGALPVGISSTTQTIADTGANICASLITTYLAALPADPSVGGGAAITTCVGAYSTGYTVLSGSDNRVTVSAPSAELGAVISVTR